jgi:tetratricopeptide (TPR) repeat protein
MKNFSIPSDGFTVSTWFYTTSNTTLSVLFASNIAEFPGYIQSYDYEGVNFYVNSNGAGTYTITSAIYQPINSSQRGSYLTLSTALGAGAQNNWHHVAWGVDYNNGTAIWKLYFDGVELYNDIAPLNNNDVNGGYPITGSKQYNHICYNSIAYYNLAIAFHTLNRYEDALDSYSKSILINPELIEAYYNKGYALQLLGKYDEALDCFLKFNKHSNGNVNFYKISLI